ncbi:hypothetical protein HPSA50_1789 [Helicobacter pylori SouthAfrica50]|uniref:Uncharacterized protein n=1 Tax=Helicobacter pylori SouthAfrica50 TaxID=1352357 RepID=T2SAM3_HELPX|nr:hypothetical protein HPSA50_1789 [Helicobacter pylori SouthAfrica50]
MKSKLTTLASLKNNQLAFLSRGLDNLLSVSFARLLIALHR